MHALVTGLLTFSLIMTSAAAAEDYPGSQDFEGLPRVSGTSIVAYARSEYTEAPFAESTDVSSSRMPVLRKPEGQHTRIVYLGEQGQTPLQIEKNYETALAELGEVEEVYSCSHKECPYQLIFGTVWEKSNYAPTSLKYPQYLISITNVSDYRYWYGTVAHEESLLHVSVLTVTANEKNPNIETRNKPVAILDILEVKDFESTLEFVDAAQMQSDISQIGKVVIYGIQFDYDSDVLKAESDATLEEMAKALSQDTALKIYVVGHTDAEGSLDYNQDLSKRRAQSVAEALSQRFGIAPDRLTPIGIGPVAPIASNDTEEGRALNRRVELVKR